ncbi:MAG TPA: hypothetical protein VIW24_06340 [Aldersonia sp.]
MATRHRRGLYLILRLDQAGSAAFIPLALTTAPTVAFFDPGPTVEAMLWSAWLLYAVWLAALGVAMACGLGRALRRGEVLPDDWWNALLNVRDDGGSGVAHTAPSRRADPAGVGLN